MDQQESGKMERKPMPGLRQETDLQQMWVRQCEAVWMGRKKPSAFLFRLPGGRMVVNTVTRCLKCGHTLRYGSFDPAEGHYYWCSNPECRDGPYGPYAMPVTPREFERGEHDPMYPVRKAISSTYGPRPCELTSERVLRGLPDRIIDQ